MPVDKPAKGLPLARGHPREKTRLLPILLGAGLRERSGSALVREHAAPRVPPAQRALTSSCAMRAQHSTPGWLDGWRATTLPKALPAGRNLHPSRTVAFEFAAITLASGSFRRVHRHAGLPRGVAIRRSTGRTRPPLQPAGQPVRPPAVQTRGRCLPVPAAI